jgi:hypothetical protein
MAYRKNREYKVEELVEFDPIPTTDTVSLRSRILLLEGEGKPRIDVRQYVTSGSYTGWTPKGLCLTETQAKLVIQRLQEAVASIEAGRKLDAEEAASTAR